jgi:hypothetical protein
MNGGTKTEFSTIRLERLQSARRDSTGPTERRRRRRTVASMLTRLTQTFSTAHTCTIKRTSLQCQLTVRTRLTLNALLCARAKQLITFRPCCGTERFQTLTCLRSLSGVTPLYDLFWYCSLKHYHVASSLGKTHDLAKTLFCFENFMVGDVSSVQ